MSRRLIGMVLLLIAVGLGWYGYELSQSVGSRLSSAFNGGPSDRVLIFYAASALCAVLGLVGLVKSR